MKTKRLIDANALKDIFYKYKRYGADDEEERIHNDAIDQCIVALNAAPSFNRPRGHWIDSDMLFEPSECSVCKSKMYNPSGAKYCPHCGAEMEEQAMKQKLNLRIRIKDGKTYVSQNNGEWIVNEWDSLTDDMRLILSVLCRMDEFDVTIDAKNEELE